jgi:formylmethanofuran dehydrogenase subunit E
MPDLDTILTRSAENHKHLCPRQVLGARIALAGAAALQLDLPRSDKRLLIIAETDGCFISGLTAATGCAMHRRTLRLADYGKVAATFIDTKTGQAVRVAPQHDVREKSADYVPAGTKRYHSQLQAYQQMADHDLLTIHPVQLTTPLSQIISRPGVRVNCTACGEEIINERELPGPTGPLCASCAGQSYYTTP